MIKETNFYNDFFYTLEKLNAEVTIYSQWDQLERTGCVNNFRIIVDKSNRYFREGYYFTDSDAYKWLDAACRIQKFHPSVDLLSKIGNLSDLICRAQEADGYIFTYNQIHFPGQRWKNLLREHELYCMGHLIEAGIAYYKIKNENELFQCCVKVADLLVRTFLHKKYSSIPGHEEIELALLKLYAIVPKDEYLNLANQFLKQRGRLSFYWIRILKQNFETKRKTKKIQKLRKLFYSNTEFQEIILPPNVVFESGKGMRRKDFFNTYSGKYLQTHRPIEKQKIPEGHAVRFTYLMTAIAMKILLEKDNDLINTLETSWKHMVTKRMFVTGGIGQLPVTEGFDKDYQLDPKYAYCESCAGVGSLLWSWQMTLLTKKAYYADLFEWQFYNAVLVGLGTDGKSYFYRNPIEVMKEYNRKEWYKCACCPPNISRTIASIDEQILTYTDNEIWIHQYITSETELNISTPISCSIQSKFPFSGGIEIKLTNDKYQKLTLHLRIPSWTDNFIVSYNNNLMEQQITKKNNFFSTASGYNPFTSYYYDLKLEILHEVSIKLNFTLDTKLLLPDAKVKSISGKKTLSCGPLVYCLEQIKNSVDIFSCTIDQNSLKYNDSDHTITGIDISNKIVTFTPYFQWANEGATKMTVFTQFS